MISCTRATTLGIQMRAMVVWRGTLHKFNNAYELVSLDEVWALMPP